MNDKGDTREDLKIPDGELGQKIREEFGKEDITVIVSQFKILWAELHFIFNVLFSLYSVQSWLLLVKKLSLLRRTLIIKTTIYKQCKF